MTIPLIRCLLTVSVAAIAAIAAAAAPAGEVPLLASWSMEPSGDGRTMVDEGPLHIDGRLGEGASFVEGGKRGHALRLTAQGRSQVTVAEPKLINRIGGPFSMTMWIKPEALAEKNCIASILSKREVLWMGAPFGIGLGDNGAVVGEFSNGRDWNANVRSGPLCAVGTWTHIAITVQADGDRVLYVNGHQIDRRHMDGSLASNDQPLFFGFQESGTWNGGGRCHYRGLLDDVRLYAAALTEDEVKLDGESRLPTRAATAKDLVAPTQFVTMHLVRYDMPIGLRGKPGMTRQLAERRPGPDAIDWPACQLAGSPLFDHGAERGIFLPLREDGRSHALFQLDDDAHIEPGDHWLRALQWLWGQRFIYTSDHTARSNDKDYELWAFPIIIRAAGGHFHAVAVSCGGTTIYDKDVAPAELASLTLLLPQSASAAPYQITVDGRASAAMAVGLQPVQAGNPQDLLIPVHQVLPGSGPAITIDTLEHPSQFPNQKEWDEDRAAVAGAQALLAPEAAPADAHLPLAARIGRTVPCSPLSTYAVSLTHGMSGGFLFHSEQGPGFTGSVEQYAQLLNEQNYDRVFEQIAAKQLDGEDARLGCDAWLRALQAHGLQGGANIVSLCDASQSFYCATIPEYHAPKYRDMQLILQRLARFPNFCGVTIGADNAGYVPYWDWAPPHPEKSWSEGLAVLMGTLKPRVPVGPALSPQKDYEVRAADQRAFLAYIARYDTTFSGCGYLSQAAHEVCDLPVTSGSFGSSPGVLGSGGWPAGTIPGLQLFAGVDTLQSYDWNELKSSKPMHQVALIDRLRSYYPDKPAWCLIDDFHLLFGREARERAYALALTRGIKAIGTTTLANAAQQKQWANPGAGHDIAEMNAWIHRFGGLYAMSEPSASIGVLYVEDQAISRPIKADERHGCHEGMVSEALFLAHAAGWPAKIITPQELRRGLPPGMHAVLLVGLNRFDDSWHWYDGLETELTAFVAAGGRLIADDESVCPVATTASGLSIRSYVTQSDMDATPVLLARNAENITRLRTAMQGIAPPIAASSDPTVWAIPMTAGDTQVVTVVNWGVVPRSNASAVVKPQHGHLSWTTTRPIYDLRRGRKLTEQEASDVDLTTDAFQVYCLPAHEPGPPALRLHSTPQGQLTCTVSLGDGPVLPGIPIAVRVSLGSDTTTLFTASGATLTLPVTTHDAGQLTIVATDLIDGLATTSTSTLTAAPAAAGGGSASAAAMARFLARTQRLVIALTAEQRADAAVSALATQLQSALTAHGRSAEVRTIAANDLVVSLQPALPACHFPHWSTIPADLVLLGMPTTNVLLLDQARGRLLPPGLGSLAAGHALVSVSLSPFVGEFQALNLLASDHDGLAEAVRLVGLSATH